MRPARGQCEQRRFPADGLIKLGGGREHVAPFCPVSQFSVSDSQCKCPWTTKNVTWGYLRSLSEGSLLLLRHLYNTYSQMSALLADWLDCMQCL